MTSLPPSAVSLTLRALAAKQQQAAAAPGARPTASQAMTEANAGDYLQESARRPIYVLLCSATAPQCDELQRAGGRRIWRATATAWAW